MIWLAIFYIFLMVSKSHVQSQTNNEVIYLQVLCVFIPSLIYIVFLCAVDLSCCPKTIKNTLLHKVNLFGIGSKDNSDHIFSLRRDVHQCACAGMCFS